MANNAVINAYARSVNPQGVATVSDKDHAREVLSIAFSKGDYEAAVKQMQVEVNAELKAPGKVREGMRQFFMNQESGGKQDENIVTLPDGRKATFPDAAKAKAFKERAGIK